MKNKYFIILILVLIVSLLGNAFFILKLKQQPLSIDVGNANSRATYFTIHNVKQAHEITKGKGIKVGILDHYFGYGAHKELYNDCIDFLNDPNSLNNISEHGYWMATTLKEIAPECEIYGLNTINSKDENSKVDAIIKAIDWAIENHIDILTYSQPAISENNRKRFDDAVDKATKNNIVTTFIHYDSPNNLWPGGMVSDDKLEASARKPDLNILHYDYNSLLIDTYSQYEKSKDGVRNGENTPYLSISSTSVVTGGFVALLKSINNTLTPNEYKDILKKTSSNIVFKDPYTLKESQCSNVPDIGKAALYIKDNFK
ncbi:S8 family serine peptidase [Clostridium sp. C2-6-12]|uniref:S8 family serine peptidase n=1 Tax=Clostridium sp. C2-6-12 TaxID=2698832 RepID=UPI00136987F7|nr:S8 family serine peptidase [Clostridium sp. C2-6-12]